MSADSFDEFKYEPCSVSLDSAARRHYWAVAIGLQAVDGLEVSHYVRELAQTYEQGEQSLANIGKCIRDYHADRNDPIHREADLVSQRMVELLEEGSFALAPDMLSLIHRRLFCDLDDSVYHPGCFKQDRLVKQEDILNGDSVLYADPSMIQLSLDHLFREEGRLAYGVSFDAEELSRFARFISLIWQVHPFVEGNTRTVALFSELYLGNLGFNLENDPFEKNARYFRDALVRANYRNNAAGVLPDITFLEGFYANVLGLSQSVLNREDLICTPLFEDPSLLKNMSPARALKR